MAEKEAKVAEAKPKAVAPKKSKGAELKTKKTEASVEDFINSVPDEQKREDSFAIIGMMKKASGEEPKMWGSAIIGFGSTVLKYPTGRELDWMKIGFSPRKANISLYISMNAQEHADALSRLGKHKTGVGCIYINKLTDVDVNVLREMIETALKK